MRSHRAELEKTVIFLHVPKTAGSTLYRIIDRHYPKKSIYTMEIDGCIDDFKALDDAHRSKIRVLRGHHGFGLHKFLPGPAAYFTILRDPIERVISYYYFIRRTPRHYCYDLIASCDMSLRDFVVSRNDAMADNAQTRLLSGLETGHEIAVGECTEHELRAAKDNLRDHFTVVGLTEEFDRTLLLLSRAFGWRKLFYDRQNVSSNRPRKEELPQATLDALVSANLLDIELYQYATELFWEQVGRQGDRFATQVESFRRMNQWVGPLVGLQWTIRGISVRAWIRRLLGIS